MPTIRAVRQDDRAALEAALRSDQTFRPDEIAVALELIDDAIAGSGDYWIRVAELAADAAEPAPGVPSSAAGGVAGYICYGPTPMTASTYDLYWIVCHARARGRGVASALIRAMEADLRERGGTAVRVETSELDGYGAARRLYHRMGYPEAARLADFYRQGDALVIYYKQL